MIAFFEQIKKKKNERKIIGSYRSIFHHSLTNQSHIIRLDILVDLVGNLKVDFGEPHRFYAGLWLR